MFLGRRRSWWGYKCIVWVKWCRPYAAYDFTILMLKKCSAWTFYILDFFKECRFLLQRVSKFIQFSFCIWICFSFKIKSRVCVPIFKFPAYLKLLLKLHTRHSSTKLYYECALCADIALGIVYKENQSSRMHSISIQALL